MRQRLTRVLSALAVVALVAACNGDGNGNGNGNGDATEGEPVTAQSGVQVEGSLDAKPEIDIPDGEPPAQLEIVDIVEGDGEEAPAGATVTTHYVGVSWELGGEFDSSWDRGEPATFPLDRVIPGWTEGIPGMRVGGRRLLVIPPEQAYGANPPTPDIAPNDTLVFVIDLVEVS